MTSKENTARLASRLRQHEGRSLLPRFLKETAEALQEDSGGLELLGLDETALLWETFQAQLKAREDAVEPAYRRTWRTSRKAAHDTTPDERISITELIGILSLLQRASDREIYLFRTLSSYCGAVRTTSQKSLGRAFHMVELGGEDLLLSTADAKYGLHMTYNEDVIANRIRVPVYELIFWGAEWLNIVSGEELSGPPYLIDRPAAGSIT